MMYLIIALFVAILLLVLGIWALLKVNAELKGQLKNKDAAYEESTRILRNEVRLQTEHARKLAKEIADIKHMSLNDVLTELQND